MQFITRLFALTRAVQLRRQFREVSRLLEELNPQMRRQLGGLALREMAAAAKCEFPHLYGTPPDEKYLPWGTGTETGIERLRSDNIQVRLRGSALWLTVAYHETMDSPFGEQQELHRQLIRTLRTLKETVPVDQVQRWMNDGAESAA